MDAYSGERNYVFVSYSHEDESRAMAFIAALGRHFNVWYDKNLHSGKDWVDEIADREADSSAVFFLISEASLHSEYCKDEVSFARSGHIPLFAIELDKGIDYPRGFGLLLARTHREGFYDPKDYDRHLKELIYSSELLISLEKEMESPMEEEEVREITPKPAPSPIDPDLLAKAREGDIKANLEVAKRYRHIDEPKSFLYLSKAASKEDIEALILLPSYYRYGIGTKMDMAKFIEASKVLEAKGRSEGSVYLGEAYTLGLGCEYDPRKGVSYFKKASEQGDIMGKFFLSGALLFGNGIKKDAKRALEIASSLVQGNSMLGEYIEGVAYSSGSGVEKDLRRAYNLFSSSAKKGFAKAKTKLGLFLYSGLAGEKDYEKAFSLFEEAGKDFDSLALYFLALLYREGRGVGPNSYLYMEKMELSAKLGCPKAMGQLALQYGQQGIYFDKQKSYLYALMASEREEPEGYLALANCYIKGYGVKKNMAKAMMYNAKWNASKNK